MGKIPLSLKFKSNSKKSKPPKYSKEGTKWKEIIKLKI
jgi:hypothetical protein